MHAYLKIGTNHFKSWATQEGLDLSVLRPAATHHSDDLAALLKAVRLL